jgi:hypothetical protein
MSTEKSPAGIGSVFCSTTPTAKLLDRLHIVPLGAGRTASNQRSERSECELGSTSIQNHYRNQVSDLRLMTSRRNLSTDRVS